MALDVNCWRVIVARAYCIKGKGDRLPSLLVRRVDEEFEGNSLRLRLG
jgi:hypothetical protein